MIIRRCVQVLILGGVTGAAAAAEDWPEFRGPTGQGIVRSEKLPLEWNCSSEGQCSSNITWKTAIPGRGWSSPVLKGDRLFLTSAVSEGQGLSLRVLCLDA